MSADWKSSKVQNFLEREIKTRNIPFENKKMGSKAVFEKYKFYPEMQGVECNKTFQRRLVSLRKIVCGS